MYLIQVGHCRAGLEPPISQGQFMTTADALVSIKRAAAQSGAPKFSRAVGFPQQQQLNEPTPDSGSWLATHAASKRPSSFAHPLWAVIGLAGAYRAEPTGALHIVKQQGDKPPSRTLKIVLNGRVRVSGETSELSHELAPIVCRIRIAALGQVLEEPVTMNPDQTTSLAVAVEGERFVLRR